MGTREESRKLSDAGGRLAAYSDAARSALNKKLERLYKAQFWSHAGGTTAIEYAMIGSLISIVIITALTSMGTFVSSVFTTIAAQL